MDDLGHFDLWATLCTSSVFAWQKNRGPAHHYCLSSGYTRAKNLWKGLELNFIISKNKIFFLIKLNLRFLSNLYTARTYPRLGSSHDLVRHSYCSSSVRCYRVPHGSDDRLWSKDPWIFGPRVRLGWRCHVETAHYDGRQNLHGEFQVHQQPKLLCNCHLGRPNCPKDSEWHIRADLFNPKPVFLYLESLSHSQ